MAKFLASPAGQKVATTEPQERKRPRDRINVNQLIDRLYADITGDTTAKALTPSQIRAAEILLNKALPNLQATTVSGDPDGVPIQNKHTVEFINASPRKSEV